MIADGESAEDVVHQMHGCMLASVQPSVEGFMRGRGQDGMAEGLELSASALGDALQDVPVSVADVQQEDLARSAGIRRRCWAKVLLDAYQVLEDLLKNYRGVCPEGLTALDSGCTPICSPSFLRDLISLLHTSPQITHSQGATT